MYNFRVKNKNKIIKMSTENKRTAIIIIRHHEDSCDDPNEKGAKQGPDKWADGYQYVGRALAYYTETNGLCPIGNVVYVSGGGNVGGHWQTPKPKDTATVVAKSLANTYVQDFKSNDPLFHSVNTLQNAGDQTLLGTYISYNNSFLESIVSAFKTCTDWIVSLFTTQDTMLQTVNTLQNAGDQTLLGKYIGDNNYVGYKAIVDNIITTMQTLDYKYSILLVGDYNGLSKEARNMEINPNQPDVKKHLYEIFEDKIGEKLESPKYWDQWYAMYSIEFDNNGKFLKSGSSLGQGTSNGFCIDKHSRNLQKLPNSSFVYPYIDQNVLTQDLSEIQMEEQNLDVTNCSCYNCQ